MAFFSSVSNLTSCHASASVGSASGSFPAHKRDETDLAITSEQAIEHPIVPFTNQTVFEGDGQTCCYPGCESKCAHWSSMLDHVRRTHMGGKLCPPVLGSVLHAKGGRYNNDRRNNRALKIGWRPKRAAQQVDAAAPPMRTEDPGEYQWVVKRCWVKADFVVYPLTLKDLCDPRCGSADVFKKTRVDSEEDNIGSETANRKGSSPSLVQLKNLTFPKSTSSCALAAHQPDFSIQTAERPQLTASSSPQDLNTTEMARMLVNVHTLAQKDHDKKELVV